VPIAREPNETRQRAAFAGYDGLFSAASRDNILCMSARPFAVVAGARPRGRKSKAEQPVPQSELAKRWRQEGVATETTRADQDVIPLLDGWVRVLEKRAGSYPSELR